MDWKRAIWILVVSFFVLNIVLVANLFIKTMPGESFKLEEDQQKALKTYLESRGIKFETQLPDKGVAVPFLEVGRESSDQEKLVEMFFSEGVERVEKIEGGEKFISGRRQLILMESGSVIFEDGEATEEVPELNGERALQIAEKFVKDHGGLPEHAKLNYVRYEPKTGGYVVEYVGNYRGFFVANSYIRLLVTRSGVVRFERNFLKPIGFEGKRRQVIPPLTAVMKVDAERKSNSPTVVKKVEQGFYSQFYNAERWLAAPVWKVELESGEIYYVNAYTGELER